MKQPHSHKTKVAVIGGGISGLSAALKLHELAKASKTQMECTIFEAGARAGGIIESNIVNNCVLEIGADSFITNKPWGMDLVRRLGLEDQIESTNHQWRRSLIVRGKTLYPLPEGFRLIAPTNISAFLASSLLSYAGKARVLMDLVIPPKQNLSIQQAQHATGTSDTSTLTEETVASFARRRLGIEALERIIQPMIGGIYVGDVRRLSIQATLPWIASLESEYGSIIKGLMATTSQDNNSGSGVRYGMFVSLKGGLQKLVDTIVSRLPGNALKLNSGVKQITCSSDSGSNRIELLLENDSSSVVDAAIVALPAFQASKLVEHLDEPLAQELKNIEYASSVILNFIYKREQISHPLDGFGFVVPHCERRAIIGCTFSSVKFTERAPTDTAVLRVFMGGSLNPHMIELEDKLLIRLAKADLEMFLGVTGEPSFVSVSRYRDAMPQYVIGHLKRIKNIMERLESFPGLALAGNAYHGIGIPDCIHSGELAAQQVHDYTVQLLKTKPIPIPNTNSGAKGSEEPAAQRSL